MADRTRAPTKAAHAARVAETLRANLQRRKAQARSRSAMDAMEGAEQPEPLADARRLDEPDTEMPPPRRGE